MDTNNSVQVVLPEEPARVYRINGRVAGMVRWLLVNYERVTAPPTIKIHFDCIGGKVSGVELTQLERL